MLIAGVDSCLPAPSDRVRDFSNLNLGDWSELNRHLHLLSSRQQRHLRSMERKIELFPSRYNHPGYLAQSAILLLSEGWSSCERYACCGIRNPGNPSGACKLHKFCPYCAWREKRNAHLRYVPAFDSGTWYFLTGSFTGELTLRPDSIGEGSNNWLHYWNAYKSGFEKWVAAKSVNGVYWVEELAVTSFLPTNTLPHVHAVVDAAWLEEEDVAQLSAFVNQALGAVFGDQHLPANTHFSPIQSARSLMDHLGYMHKPINVLKAYQQAWPRASFHHRHLAQELNSQASDLILGYTLVTTGRKRINYKGNLNPKAGNFIGISKKDQEKYHKALAEIRAQANEEYIEISPEESEVGQTYGAGIESAFSNRPVPTDPSAHENVVAVPARTKSEASKTTSGQHHTTL